MDIGTSLKSILKSRYEMLSRIAEKAYEEGYSLKINVPTGVWHLKNRFYKDDETLNITLDIDSEKVQE